MRHTVSGNRAGLLLRTLVLGGVSTMALAFAAPGFAQTAAPAAAPAAAPSSDSTLVVVTGLRGSLQKSLNVKKNAVGVVDAISAEDIGKFPDSSLAAAIQRIPGISVSRGVSSMSSTGSTTSTGGATEITVRGFGPTFNETLYDGREAATGTTTRAFDMSSVGSDYVGEVDILKTPDATLSSGAIGATVNIKFPKPFDHPGFQFSAGGDYSKASKADGTGSGGFLLSDTFANDTIGILADYHTSDKKTSGNHLNIQGWEGTTINGSQLATPTTATGINAWFIQDYGIYHEETDEKRVDGRLAFQWRPNENWDITLDDNYSKDTTQQYQYGMSVWFSAANLTNIKQASDGTITSFNQPGTPQDFQAQFNGQVLENNDVGLNVKWNVNDKFKVMADIAQSTSKLNPQGQYSSLDMDYGYGGTNTTNLGLTGVGVNALPYLTNYGPNGNASQFENAAIIGSHVVPITSTQNDDTINQAKLEAKWSEDNLVLTGGIQYIDDDKKLSEYDTQTNNDWQAFAGYGPASGGNGVALPASWFTNSFSTANFIRGFGNAGNLPPQILETNPFTILNYLNGLGSNPATIAAANANCGCNYSGTIQMALNPSLQQEIKEQTFAFYGNMLFKSKIEDMPLTVNVGIRDEQTNVVSTGEGELPISLQQQTSDLTAYKTIFSALTPERGTNKYRYLLPNIDINLQVNDQWKVRFDASRTLTRPPLSDLTPDFNYSASPRVGQLTGSVGSPTLLPFLSDNIDIGAEWYYNRNSYLSADVFVKDVTNFINNTSFTQTLAGVPEVNTSGVTTSTSSTWTISTNENSGSAEVTGLELAWQHVFGDTGWGYQANATFVHTNNPYNPNQLGTSSALPGLANSANFVGFYDKNGLQARIAVNYRAAYLDHFGQLQNGSAFGIEPTFVNSSTTVDFSGSYAFAKNWSVYLTGDNLTNETYSTHGRYKEQLLDAVDYGQRWTVGFHYKY